MGRLRSIRRLLGRKLRDASGTIIIPQRDGSVVRFSEYDLADAYVRNLAIGRAKGSGEEPPEAHPLQLALLNVAEPRAWHAAYVDMLEKKDKVESLFEP